MKHLNESTLKNFQKTWYIENNAVRIQCYDENKPMLNDYPCFDSIEEAQEHIKNSLSLRQEDIDVQKISDEELESLNYAIDNLSKVLVDEFLPLIKNINSNIINLSDIFLTKTIEPITIDLSNVDPNELKKINNVIEDVNKQ
jgi:protein subunit release factor A